MKRGLLIMIAVFTLMSGSVTAQKYGYIDAQALLIELPSYKAAESEMKRFQEGKEEELKDMYDNFTKQRDQLDADITAGTLSDQIIESRYKDLAKLEQRIQQFQQSIQQEISVKNEELLAPIVEKVRASIKKVGEANGYTFIYDKAVLLYVDPKADNIKELVLKDLNAGTK